MKYKQITLISGYNSLPLHIAYSNNISKTNTAVVLHPGAFEFLWGDNQRYKNILSWFGTHLASKPQCFSYETSRQAVTREKDEDKFTYWQRLFSAKTFKDELDDVNKVLNYISSLDYIENIFTVGFSLGGTLSLLLSEKFPKVKKICLIGSAISTKREVLPVLKGYPKKVDIKKIIKSFDKSLLFIQGFKEEVVPFEDAEEVIHTIKKAQYISLIRIAQANHMFFSDDNEFGLIHNEKLLRTIGNFFEEN